MTLHPASSVPSASSVDETVRGVFDASATVTPHGDFLILAITAGLGNGWHFSPAVLRASLPLWEGVETFVDHAPLDGGAGAARRSVRDLGGSKHQATRTRKGRLLTR